MAVRIYVDESGTHAAEWFLVGMLFVPDHGKLHARLCDVKRRLEYFNRSPKRKARFREAHLAEFKSQRDLELAKAWFDAFVEDSCYFRAVVVDWSIWEPNYFGQWDEPEALKRRRAYKKWAEMLLHPELKEPSLEHGIYNARLMLDRLRIMHGYDILDHLRERFTKNYSGESPYIESFEHVQSWRDAHQCLQLCDLLVGSVYQALVPSTKKIKSSVPDLLLESLADSGVTSLEPKFWRQFDDTSIRKRFQKFSLWYWRPPSAKAKAKRNKRKKRPRMG